MPGEKGGQDIFGAYEIVAGLAEAAVERAGHEQVDVGRGPGRVRRDPEPRVHPAARRAAGNRAAEDRRRSAPSVEFPIGRLPWRDATSASPPGALFKPGPSKTSEPGDDLDAGEPGVDYKWAHIINVVDAQGNLIEDWTQWDKMFRRPHSVFESPYDPQKDVWIVDDYRHAIFRFSNDGKKLLQTIGTAERAGRRCDALLPPDVHGVAARTATSSSPTATRTRAS